MMLLAVGVMLLAVDVMLLAVDVMLLAVSGPIDGGAGVGYLRGVGGILRRPRGGSCGPSHGGALAPQIVVAGAPDAPPTPL